MIVGMSWYCLEIVLFAAAAVIARLVSQEVATPTLVALRYIGGFLLAFALLAPLWLSGARSAVRDAGPAFSVPYVMREAASLLSGILWFTGLTLIPLSLATALFFMRVPFLSVLSVIVLREKLTPLNVATAATGFVGVLISVRPDLQPVTGGTVLVLLAAFTSAISTVLLKPLSARDPPSIVVFRLTLVAIPACVGIVGFTPPDSLSVSSLSVILGLGPMAMLAIFATTHAYRHADVCRLAPLEFLRFVAAVLAGLLIFGEVPDSRTWIGGCLIILANVVNARKEPHPCRRASASQEERTPQ
jgi:drug/metabolite transporter (DMT)-like permease